MSALCANAVVRLFDERIRPLLSTARIAINDQLLRPTWPSPRRKWRKAIAVPPLAGVTEPADRYVSCCEVPVLGLGAERRTGPWPSPSDATHPWRPGSLRRRGAQTRALRRNGAGRWERCQAVGATSGRRLRAVVQWLSPIQYWRQQMPPGCGGAGSCGHRLGEMIAASGVRLPSIGTIPS